MQVLFEFLVLKLTFLYGNIWLIEWQKFYDWILWTWLYWNSGINTGYKWLIILKKTNSVVEIFHSEITVNYRKCTCVLFLPYRIYRIYIPTKWYYKVVQLKNACYKWKCTSIGFKSSIFSVAKVLFISSCKWAIYFINIIFNSNYHTVHFGDIYKIQYV